MATGTPRFDEQVDPDLAPGLDVYRMLGFRQTDFSPEPLAALRTDGSDPTCSAYVDALGCVVVSVDDRLAPEHPDPAPVEDCLAGLRWTVESAPDLGIDPERVVVAGQSAGGGLAAGTCVLARDLGGPSVAFQCLVYPMLDDRNETPSATEFLRDRVVEPRAQRIRVGRVARRPRG